MLMQSRWLFVLILALAVGATGCGRKKKDLEAESPDSVPSADTASVDGSGNAEALPVVDEATPFDDSLKAPAPEVKGTGDMMTYAVQKGDTLMKIAFNLYGDIAQWKNIYAWNKDTLKKASQLEKGMELKYEKPSNEPAIERNGDPYLIKKGDTLGTIADDVYAKRSKWKKLWNNNRSLIKNPNRIYTGFYLYYQITEQEKKLAQQIKAKRAAMAKTTPSEISPVAETTQAVPSGELAPATSANVGTGALKSGGLSALAAPRAPASVPAATAPPAKK